MVPILSVQLAQDQDVETLTLNFRIPFILVINIIISVPVNKLTEKIHVRPVWSLHAHSDYVIIIYD